MLQDRRVGCQSVKTLKYAKIEHSGADEIGRRGVLSRLAGGKRSVSASDGYPVLCGSAKETCGGLSHAFRAKSGQLL